MRRPTRNQVAAVAATGVAVALSIVVVRQQKQIDLLTTGVNVLGYMIQDTNESLLIVDEAVGFLGDMVLS
jgi:hypothetical protein